MQTISVPVIRTDADFKEACDRLASISSAPAGSLERDEADVLWLVLEDFERKHYGPPPGASPIEMVRWIMEKNELSQVDLIPVFGSAAAVSSFLSGRRRLSKAQIKGLTARYKVSAFDLIA